jgi:putative tricarboxylic transport membrane protein
MLVKNKKDFFSGFFLLLLGVYLAFRSMQLSVWSRFGPDEGFIPLLTAVIIIGISLVITIKSLSLTRGQEKEETLEKQKKEIGSVFKVSLYIVLIILYGLFLEKVGFLITSALFLFIMLKYVEKQSWKMTTFAGLASIITSYLLFVYFLGVLLPRGLIKWW